jgi:hypothetical protein
LQWWSLLIIQIIKSIPVAEAIALPSFPSPVEQSILSELVPLHIVANSSLLGGRRFHQLTLKLGERQNRGR